MAYGSMTGDEPISEKKQDRLGRATLAEQIAKVISAYQEPTSLVFGIYGKWGSGKTSLLWMIEEALAPDIECIWFNPWMFADVTNLVRSFFKTIGEQFDKSITGRKEKVGKWLEEYGSLS